jgi:hypothetical protein
MMRTSEEVMTRTDVRKFEPYVEAGPMTDCAGFHVQRLYPTDSQLARVVTNAGQPALSCLIQFIVEPLAVQGGSTKVRLHTRLYDRSRSLVGMWPPIGTEANDPEYPTSESVTISRRAHKPLDLDLVEDFIYDGSEDVFRDEDGQQVTVRKMRDHAYSHHCQTYRPLFAWRWRLTGLPRTVAYKVVWRGQDACWWLLFNFYDIELAEEKSRTALDPFRTYKAADFRRVAEPNKPLSSFFGFQSSRKSFFTNMLVLAAGFGLAYWKLPRWELVRAIYDNTALTTAGLVLGFLVADVAGPWILIRTICGLSRLRPTVLFFTRKVRGLRRHRSQPQGGVE